MFEHSMALVLAFLSVGTLSPQEGLWVEGAGQPPVPHTRLRELTRLRLRSGFKIGL